MNRMIICTFFLSTLALMAQDAANQNVLRNPGFETKDEKNEKLPAEWGIFCEKGEPTAFTLVSENAKEGQSALKMAFDTSASGFYGIGQRIPVKAGQTVTFAAAFRNVSLRDDSYVQISIEWVNGEEPKKEITRAWGPATKAGDMTTDGWKKFEVTAVAPTGAVEMNIVVTLFPSKSPDGAVLVDDMNVVVKDVEKKS